MRPERKTHPCPVDGRRVYWEIGRSGRCMLLKSAGGGIPTEYSGKGGEGKEKKRPHQEKFEKKL